MLFEKRAIPAVAILTRPFVPTARALAEIQSMPGYPFVVLPHPITSLTAEEARALADLATPYVEALLVAGAPRPGDGVVAIVGAPANPTGSDAEIRALTEELARGLRADGADLAARVSGLQELTLTLCIGDETCRECVMPGPHLLAILRSEAARRLGPGWRVRLEDPREGAVLD